MTTQKSKKKKLVKKLLLLLYQPRTTMICRRRNLSLWAMLLPLVLQGLASRAQSALHRLGRSSRNRNLPSVTSIQLMLQIIDVSTKTIVVAKLSQGDRININGLGPLTLHAIVSGSTIKSVTFGYNGNSTFRTESIAPYTFCGDFGGTFYPCSEFQVGTHTVTATPFSQSGGKGMAGPMTNITFTLTSGEPIITSTAQSKSPTFSPTKAPVVTAPVFVTTATPITAPNQTLPIVVIPAPVVAPIQAHPVVAPTLTAVTVPTPAPVGIPSPSSCKVPKFVGNWLPTTVYPIPAAEAQGSVIGDDFVVISGFTRGYGRATAKNYALNLRHPNATWRAMDDLPIAQGITHGAFCVVGMKLYMCGGYLGGHPGPHIDTCLVYDHSIPPGSKKQWSFLPSLPEGRAGGGMVYDPHRDALIFAGGAERPKRGNPNSVDYQHAWMFEFNDAGGGSAGTVWNPLPDIPFLSNHMSYVTTTDGLGRTRHYFFGGQIGENEFTGNLDANYEWDSTNATWIQRSNLPFTRGHASSSTTAVPCGYVIAGGSTNEFGKPRTLVTMMFLRTVGPSLVICQTPSTRQSVGLIL